VRIDVQMMDEASSAAPSFFMHNILYILYIIICGLCIYYIVSKKDVQSRSSVSLPIGRNLGTGGNAPPQWLKLFCEAGGSHDEAKLEQTPYPFQPH